MEELVNQIQRLSSSNSEEEKSRFHSVLKQAEESLLRPQASQLAPYLEQLDPSTHSLGYLYILEAYIGAALSKEQAGVLVPVVVTFIESCTAEQIRLVPDKFVSVCKKFKEEVVLLRTPMRGIAPIRTAIRKLQSSPEQLTTLHPDFLLLCLLAKCYKSGLSILQEDIFEIDQPKDFFLYCYYGGMVCIGQKNFRKAMELLKAVVTAPMSSTNAIAVEAHKKYILVSLINNGQFSTGLPKHMSAMGQRNLKNYCQ
ncbi:Cop9 signalosome complex subunit 3 like, partial [Thalictrum thalictroides]